MKNEEKKKGLFGGLFASKKERGISGCCNIELEEINEDKDDNKNNSEVSNKDNNSCCN